MPQDLSQDLTSLREWLAKEPYLPQDFDELMLKKFLHSCYGSLEKTKKCIDKFATVRAEMTEIFTDRDPLSPKLQTAFSITNVVTYKFEKNEIMIHQLDDPTLESFSFYDLLKGFSMQADNWLRFHNFLPDAHIVVLDIKDYTWKAVAKSNVLFFKDFLLFLLEAIPVRMKEVHVINCPTYIDKLYSLIKPALPADLRNLIKFHATAQGLQKTIDKKYLPTEYGGDAQSMREQQKEWVRDIEAQRDWYLNDKAWKADLSKKPKSGDGVVENSMSGSFRTLSID